MCGVEEIADRVRGLGSFQCSFGRSGRGGRFEAVGVLLAPEGEDGRRDEPERHEPEEDAERDSVRDQAASQLASVLHLANQGRTRKRLAPSADRRQLFGHRRSRPTLGGSSAHRSAFCVVILGIVALLT